MTKEEIVVALLDDMEMPYLQDWQARDIVDFVIKNYHPSLPSVLDEAAIPESEMDEWMKYGPHTNYPWCSIPDAIKITAEHFFALGKQAGAEWMAGQGQTFVAHVDNGCAIASGVKLPFVLWDTYEDGDVLKVQIRKKQ